MREGVSEGVRLSSHPTMLRLNCMPRLMVRHAHADGPHRDGANGTDAAGANGVGMNMDSAWGLGARGANAD